MTGFWLVSYAVLWLLVLGEGLVILILAREIESLHARLEAAERRKSRPEEDARPADGHRQSAKVELTSAAQDSGR